MLPAGWEAEKTPQGKMYFVDHNNGTTSWEDPRPLPVGFEAKKDGSGRTYFIDHRNKRTQWEDPRPPLQIGQGHLEPATEQMQPTLQQIPSGLFSRPHRRTSLLSKNNDLLSQPSETDGNSQLLVKPTVKEQPANLRCTNNPTCSQDHPLEATETFSEDYTLPTWNCDECKSSFPKQLRWSCQICLYDICTLCYCNPEGTQKEKDAVPDCSSDLKVEIPQSNVQPFPAAVISIKYSLERVTSATARSSMSSRLSAGLLRGRRLSTPEDDEDHETKSSSGPLKKGLTISSVDIAGVSADFSGRGLLDKDIKFIASELKGCNFVPKSGLLGKNTCSLCKRAKKHHPLSSSLTHLDLSGMKIVSKTAGKLADAILVNKTLTSLNYKDCSQMARVGIDAMTKAVCAREPPFNNFSGIPISKMVQNDQTIQVLDFRGQNLGNVELCVLGHYLVKNSSIKSLDIRGSGLVGRSAAYCLVESVVGRSDAMEVFSGIPIKQLLQNNPEITSCNLENSGCGNAEAFMLAHCLEINSTLVRLNLAKNPAISVAGYERLAFALAANSSLQALEIDSVNSSWLHTAKTLVQLNGDVKQINLAEVHLESDQILLIADKVKTAQSIETIDFTCKKMGSNLPLSIWQTFALSALECQSFRTLIIKGEIPVDKFRMKCDVIDLSGQRMKDRGAAVVATLLQNSSVTTLILNDCAINDEGANHLAEAIQFNVFLRVLKLGSNNIGKVGMNSFVNVFKTNKTLQELHLESQKSKAKNVAMARNSPLLGLAAVLRENNESALRKIVGVKLEPDAEVTLQSIHNKKCLEDATICKDQHLNLSGQSDESLQILVHILKNKNSATSLDLSASLKQKFGPAGAKALAEMMLDNSTIINLNVSGNNANTWDTLLKQLVEMNRMPSKVECHYKQTKLDEEKLVLLLKKLQSNRSVQQFSLVDFKFKQKNPQFTVSLVGSAFGDVLKNNSCLQILSLKSSKLSSTFFAGLATGLKENHELKELNLESNPGGDDAITCLSQSLQASMTGLVVLNLGNFGLTDQGVAQLANALAVNGSLEVVDLSSNGNLTDKSAIDLTQALQVNNSLLSVLLSGCKVSLSWIGLINQLTALNKKCSTEFDLRNQSFSDEHLEAFSQKLQKSDIVVTLKLEGNQFSETGISKFNRLLEGRENQIIQYVTGIELSALSISALSHNRGLAAVKELRSKKRIVRFSGKKIGDVGMKLIAEELKVNETVEFLALDDNLLTIDGAHFLAAALKVNSTLKFMLINGQEPLEIQLLQGSSEDVPSSLDLSLFNYKDEDVCIIAELLKSNKIIEFLDLSENKISCEGAKYLAGTLKINDTLKGLRLMETDIRQAGIEAFEDAIQDGCNTTIMFVDGVIDTGCSQNLKVSQVLRRNRGLQAVRDIKANSAPVFDLSNRWLGEEGTELVAEELKDNKSITELDMSKNSIDIHAAKFLVAALKENQTLNFIHLNGLISINLFAGSAPVLQHIAHKKCPSNHKIKSMTLEASSKCDLCRLCIPSRSRRYRCKECNWNLCSNCHPDSTTLDLARMQYSDPDFVIIFFLLKKNKRSREVNFVGNHITCDGILHLAELLRVNHTLSVIRLDQIGEQGRQYLEEAILFKDKANKAIQNITNFEPTNPEVENALQNNRGLQAVKEIRAARQKADLSCRKLGDIGISLVAEELERTKVVELVLSKNGFTDQGAKKIATALKKNKVLRKLNMAGNEISSNAGEWFVEVVKENLVLTEITINGVIPVSQFRNSRNIEDINLSSKGYQDVDAMIVATLLQLNATVMEIDMRFNPGIQQKGAQAIVAACKARSSAGRGLVMFSGIPVEALQRSDPELIVLDVSDMGCGITEDTLVNEWLQESNSSLQTVRGVSLSEKARKALQKNRGCHQAKTMQESNPSALQIIDVGDAGIIPIANAMKGQTFTSCSVKCQVDEDARLSTKGIAPLLEALRDVKTLEVLDMSFTNCGDSCQYWVKYLGDHLSLKKVILRSCSIGEDAMRPLVQYVRSARMLEELDIQGNEIGNDALSTLFKELEFNISLKILNLRETAVSAEGLRGAAIALQGNRTLTSLNISGNNIGNDGASFIADGLKKNTGLHHLNMESNSIKEQGFSALVEALKQNQTLKSINVSRNNPALGAWAEELAAAIQGHNSLEVLCINSCEFRSIKCLANALQNGSRLKTLQLAENSLSELDVIDLFNGLQKNKCLTSLDLSYNQVGPAAIQKLFHIVEGCSNFLAAEKKCEIHQKNAENLCNVVQHRCPSNHLLSQFTTPTVVWEATCLSQHPLTQFCVKKVSAATCSSCSTLVGLPANLPPGTVLSCPACRANFVPPVSGTSCNVCKKLCTVGEYAYGCRGCNWDVCNNCHAVRQQISRFLSTKRCLGNHVLTEIQSGPHTICSVCNRTNPTATCFDCRACNWNACLTCAKGAEKKDGEVCSQCNTTVAGGTAMLRCEDCKYSLCLNCTSHAGFTCKSCHIKQSLNADCWGCSSCEFHNCDVLCGTCQKEKTLTCTECGLAKDLHPWGNKNLKELHLSGCAIGDEGLSVLCAVLKASQSFEVLSLNENDIGDECLGRLGEAVRDNRMFQKLTLRQNRIGSKGCYSLIRKGLEDHRSIAHLDLSDNLIHCRHESTSLDYLLKENSSLKRLYISNNQLVGEDFKSLVEMWESNTRSQIVELDLDWKKMDRKLWPAFRDSFQKRSQQIPKELASLLEQMLLLPGWVMQSEAEDAQVFYYNRYTNKTQWAEPSKSGGSLLSTENSKKPPPAAPKYLPTRNHNQQDANLTELSDKPPDSNPETKMQDVPNASICDECTVVVAQFYCQACGGLLCSKCNRNNHKVMEHQVVGLEMCAHCNEYPATVECKECNTTFCQKCSDERHKSKARSNHSPIDMYRSSHPTQQEKKVSASNVSEVPRNILFEEFYSVGKTLPTNSSKMIFVKQVGNEQDQQLVLKSSSGPLLKQEKKAFSYMERSVRQKALGQYIVKCHKKLIDPRSGEEALVQEKGAHNLRRFVEGKNETGSLDEKEKKDLCERVVKICYELNKCKIVWGRIKPESFVAFSNEFLESSYKAVNFGSCSIPTPSKDYCLWTDDNQPNHRYVSPERRRSIVDNQPLQADPKQDVFAAGLVLYFIWNGYDCFNDDDYTEDDWEENLLSEKAVDLSQLEDGKLKNEMSKVLRSMLDKDPAKRPSFEEILKSDLFNKDAEQLSVQESILKTVIREGMKENFSEIKQQSQQQHAEMMQQQHNNNKETIGLLKEMDKKMEEMNKAMGNTYDLIVQQSLNDGYENVPNLFLLAPCESVQEGDKKKGWTSKWKAKKDQFLKRLDLMYRFTVFVLDETQLVFPDCKDTEVELISYQDEVPGKTLLNIAHAVSFTVKIASVVGKIGGIPVPTGISSQLSEWTETTRDFAELASEMNIDKSNAHKNLTKDPKKVDIKEGKLVFGEYFEYVKKVFDKPGNLQKAIYEGRIVKVLDTKTQKTHWIYKENLKHFQEANKDNQRFKWTDRVSE